VISYWTYSERRGSKEENEGTEKERKEKGTSPKKREGIEEYYLRSGH
jgi:hypothetical protein